MKARREPFSWDGDDDNPVPPEILLGISGPKIVDDAETVVLEAQQAIGREDTGPLITVPESGKAESWIPRLITGVDRSISRRKLVAGLAVVCLLAFAHGWSVGSTRAEAASSSCGPNHCSSRGASGEWKEEQRP